MNEQTPIVVGQIWQAPNNDGVPGYRRIRILAPYPDPQPTADERWWMFEDITSVLHRSSAASTPKAIPEQNIRMVFTPEDSPNAGVSRLVDLVEETVSVTEAARAFLEAYDHASMVDAEGLASPEDRREVWEATDTAADALRAVLPASGPVGRPTTREDGTVPENARETV